MLGNAGKHVIIELSEYKLYMGHIHTLVLTREWIAMLRSTYCQWYSQPMLHSPTCRGTT